MYGTTVRFLSETSKRTAYMKVLFDVSERERTNFDVSDRERHLCSSSSSSTYKLLIDILFSGKSRHNFTKNAMSGFQWGLLKCLNMSWNHPKMLGKSFVWWRKGKSFVWWRKGKKKPTYNSGLTFKRSSKLVRKWRVLGHQVRISPEKAPNMKIQSFPTCNCFKNSLHSEAYMSWDSGVRRILFETELPFPEKIKQKKRGFFPWVCTLFAKNAFFRIWLA